MHSKRRRLISLITVIAFAVLSLAYTFRSGNSPLLGLDLQGGLSVVLKPKIATDDDKIQQAIAIMRQRIDAIGVAEPEISQQGGNILIQIPGVEDRERALQLVGQTAELRFRPVLSYCTPDAGAPAASTTTTAPGASSTTAPAAPSTTAAPAPSSSQVGLGPIGGYSVGESAAGEQAQAPASDAPTTPAPAAAPSTVAPAASDPTASTPAASTPAGQATPTPTTPQAAPISSSAGGPCLPGVTATAPADDKADQVVLLPGFDDKNDPNKVTTIYQLGPADATGNILSDASASLSQQGQWTVNPRFKPGADGIDQFNASAQKCKPAGAACPTGQQAITLDGRVISAPRIEPDQPSFTPFDADRVQISGNFNEDSGKELATQLKYGALPVELEQQQAESVSATLGRDALNAGLISGFVGLAIVAIYMIAFYRLLGALAVVKLAIEGALLWSFIALLGSHAGLALTLAGVTGIIVSIGVSLDSNVVYYEHLKEDVRNGRTVRSSVDKAFASSFRTILKADGVSIIGATLLYILSVGPVRGFAFYLIVSMVLDLFTSYFYMHPTVALALQSKFGLAHPGWFGVPPVDIEATPLARAAKKASGGTKRAIPTRPSKRTKFDKDADADAADDAADDDSPGDDTADDTETTTVT